MRIVAKWVAYWSDILLAFRDVKSIKGSEIALYPVRHNFDIFVAFVQSKEVNKESKQARATIKAADNC